MPKRKIQIKYYREINKNAKLRAMRYGAEIDGTITPSIIELFYLSKVCRYCSKILGKKNRTLDHMQPLSKKGKHSISNIALACKKCNQLKKDLTLVEFIIENGT